jgi:hypothetical protein
MGNKGTSSTGPRFHKGLAKKKAGKMKVSKKKAKK